MYVSPALGQILSFLLGAVVGGATKFFWEKYLPDWMTWRREQRVDREKLMSQFRGPAIRAMNDLQQRVFGIVQGHAEDYEYVKDIGERDYYVESTTFLIAQCWAWLEILRETMGALDYAELLKNLDQVSISFAEGGPGFQIYRLEQREIGERMLSGVKGSEKCCTSYSEFLEELRSKATPAFSRLKDRAEFMLENWLQESVRLMRVQCALVDAVSYLDPRGRWVPKDQRNKLSADAVIQELKSEKIIDKKKADSLREAAQEYGLISK